MPTPITTTSLVCTTVLLPQIQSHCRRSPQGLAVGPGRDDWGPPPACECPDRRTADHGRAAPQHGRTRRTRPASGCRTPPPRTASRRSPACPLTTGVGVVSLGPPSGSHAHGWQGAPGRWEDPAPRPSLRGLSFPHIFAPSRIRCSLAKTRFISLPLDGGGLGWGGWRCPAPSPPPLPYPRCSACPPPRLARSTAGPLQAPDGHSAAPP